MALRLAATPAIRSTARLLVRQQPMGLVKIHSCKFQHLVPFFFSHINFQE